MVLSLPILVVCVGLQPCPEATDLVAVSPRTASPAAIVTHVPSRELRTVSALPFTRVSVDGLPMPSVSKMSWARSAQPPLTMQPRRPTSKAMYMCALAVAGAYAGAYLGVAMEADGYELRGVMIGMPVGAALGGLLGWKLVP